MYCYQCEETANGIACTKAGICGKTPEVGGVQDLLTAATKRLATIAWAGRQLGVADPQVDRFVVESLFTTVTNVNFDADRLEVLVRAARQLAEASLGAYLAACVEQGVAPTVAELGSVFELDADLLGQVQQADDTVLLGRFDRIGEVVTGLQELVLYGLKGMAAYADHAMVLGVTDQAVFDFFVETLAFLDAEPTDVDTLVGKAMKVGEVNVTVMALLDKANTTTYGTPVPTPVRVTPIKGKAILISGHDLKDLHELLRQTEGTGIHVYTHSEMLPAHGYPGLKMFGHLVGNYGGAWQDQRKEFDAFPGPILMTTNCIQKPKGSYADRIFTCGLVAWPEVPHIADSDFSPVIEAALAAPGFEHDEPEQSILVGFGHETVLGLADTIIGAVKSGDVRHFFLVGGCDGHSPERSYYTDFAKAVPEDCVILTLACGKYRFNKLDFGDIGGIPRLLDIGQCNDAYSAVVIAQALAEAFDTDINGLPLSMVLSWYEQKAVCILLSLLHLGVKNVRLGPHLPAFITPPVLQVLVDNFDLKPIGTVAGDMADCLGEPLPAPEQADAPAPSVRA
jgi:hydroxylamine reductase